MMILGLDTSTPATSVALWKDGRLLGEILANHRQSHSEQLVGLVEQLLKITEATLDQVDYYACTRGPGSFTGLRIGAAAAKGFAQYHNKPIVGLSLLELTAWNAAGSSGWICPMVDAQRDQVYWGLYRWAEGRPVSIQPDGVSSVGDVLTFLKEQATEGICLGSGIVKISPESIFRGVEVLPEFFGVPRASLLCQAAAQKVISGETLDTWADFQPEYFRKSQAELHRASKGEEVQ